jgi:type I restriction enzyme M protein
MREPIELSARKRRSALEALSRERLARITGHYDLAVADRRSAASHVDAIVRAKRVDFSDVLGLLGRDELKAVCEALGLDTSGRDKHTLRDRVLGRSNGSGAERRDKVPASGGHANGAAADTGAKLTREQLEGYLWAAADILRGSIDSSDYKNFIFGLLFLKRLSDRFNEECEQLVTEGIDPEQHDEHQFFVPKRARWSQILKGATGLELLNKASAALEEANAQALEGVLAGIDYNDERKLGDARQRDNVLHRLVLHFSKINLRNDHLSEPDMLGRAYEYLIEKFADDAGKGGEFYTPNMVVRLIVELLEPKEGMRICDPTCGSGGMLIQAGKYIVEHGGRPHNFSLFGQEKNLGTWAICKMNMLLHGYPDARIEKGDVVRAPKLLQDGELMLFDRVIAKAG